MLCIFLGLLINLSFTAYSLSLRDSDYASYKLRTQNNAISKYSSNLFLGLAVTALVFNIIAGIFSAELLIYHIWLRCTGRTTYEHIIERRKRAEVSWILNTTKGGLYEQICLEIKEVWCEMCKKMCVFDWLLGAIREIAIEESVEEDK